MMPSIRKISIAYQPWEGTPSQPRFKTPVYSVEYEADGGQRVLQVSVVDAFSAQQIACRQLNIPFSISTYGGPV
jgi:hypothetical protein